MSMLLTKKKHQLTRFSIPFESSWDRKFKYLIRMSMIFSKCRIEGMLELVVNCITWGQDTLRILLSKAKTKFRESANHLKSCKFNYHMMLVCWNWLSTASLEGGIYDKGPDESIRSWLLFFKSSRARLLRSLWRAISPNSTRPIRRTMRPHDNEWIVWWVDYMRFLTWLFARNYWFPLLDASSHLYKRVCPLVGRSVGWSVGPSVRP